MLKEAFLVFCTLVVLSSASPYAVDVDAEDQQIGALPASEVANVDSSEESLEGAESANPQWGWGRRYGGWGGRGWGGGWGGGYGRGWGGGYGRGWGGGWGGGWNRRGWGGWGYGRRYWG